MIIILKIKEKIMYSVEIFWQIEKKLFEKYECIFSYIFILKYFIFWKNKKVKIAKYVKK